MLGCLKSVRFRIISEQSRQLSMKRNHKNGYDMNRNKRNNYVQTPRLQQPQSRLYEHQQFENTGKQNPQITFFRNNNPIFTNFQPEFYLNISKNAKFLVLYDISQNFRICSLFTRKNPRVLPISSEFISFYPKITRNHPEFYRTLRFLSFFTEFIEIYQFLNLK